MFDDLEEEQQLQICRDQVNQLVAVMPGKVKERPDGDEVIRVAWRVHDRNVGVFVDLYDGTCELEVKPATNLLWLNLHYEANAPDTPDGEEDDDDDDDDDPERRHFFAPDVYVDGDSETIGNQQIVFTHLPPEWQQALVAFVTRYDVKNLDASDDEFLVCFRRDIMTMPLTSFVSDAVAFCTQVCHAMETLATQARSS